jgi:diaminohydroxyphosphoribosylaminopyrimidine deaminase/5-amino-6-(5-phosphoribosylamino)uracil reductase
MESQLVRSAREVPTLIWAGPQADRSKLVRLREAGCEVELCGEADPLRRLDALLQHLTEVHQATNVLVEGGAQLLGSLMELKQIDECDIFVAPKLLGGHGAPSPVGGLGVGLVDDGPLCQELRYTPSGTDVRIQCRLYWR